jgi:DMSO reductase anchor subunit
MHPAFSIIVFTTLSGLGYGLAAMLGVGLLDPSLGATKVAHVAALALITAGLLSSVLHLGNPQRAWRALSQWRSSWLSREGVLAIATFVPLCACAYAAIFQSRYLPLAGIAGTAGAIATVYCTSMIYASLKSVPAWHTPLTTTCYLLFSGAGGALLGLFFATVGGGGTLMPALLACIFLVAAWTAKFLWRGHMKAPPLSTPESATGLGAIGRVRLFERPHINDNYLTREMGFRVARKHAAKLARLSFVFGCVAPLALIVLAVAGGANSLAVVLSGLAVATHLAGVAVERWLFFAEAKHAVMNYY